MPLTEYQSTEAVTVDLVAMRNWHFRCSIDKDRSPAIRHWHRSQVRAIQARIPKHGPGSLTLVKVALVELLATHARHVTHTVANSPEPFDWKVICSNMIAELEKSAAFGGSADAEKRPPV